MKLMNVFQYMPHRDGIKASALQIPEPASFIKINSKIFFCLEPCPFIWLNTCYLPALLFHRIEKSAYTCTQVKDAALFHRIADYETGLLFQRRVPYFLVKLVYQAFACISVGNIISRLVICAD